MNLFTRFPIRRTIPLCLLLGALLAEGYTMKYNQNLADAEEEKEALAFVTQDMTQLQENIGNRLRMGDWEGVQSAIVTRGSNRNVTVAVLADDAGTVIGSTSLKLIGVSISQALPDVDAALLREVGATLTGRVFLSHDRKLVTACYPVILGAKGGDIRPHRVGIVCLRYDLTYAKARRRHESERQALVMAGFYAGGFLLLGLLLHLVLTRRVGRLVSAARRIAAGDLSAQTGLQGKDELAQIGGAFDRMAGEIARGHVALQKAAVEYRIVADNTYDWEFWLSPANEFIYISPSCKRITGYDADEFRADTGLMERIVHPDDRSRFDDHRCAALQRMLPGELEYRIVRPDGTIRWIDHVCQPVFNEKGDFLGTRASNRDISERKLADEALHRLNRELRAISKCNQLLIRAEDEQTLLNDICRIVCDEAGYRMAWVGYAEKDEARTIRPVAWAGAEDGYLEQAGLIWADTERGGGPAGVAIRSGESACIQDFTTDPKAAPWRDSALQRGCRSVIALPLKDEDAITFGLLCIYSTKPNAFTPDEIRLLEELSGDLAFGIMVLRARIERKRAQEKEHLLSAIVQSSDDGIVAEDLDGIILSWNRGAERIYGYSAEEIIGKSVAMVIPPDHPDELAEMLTHLRRGEGVAHYTTERLRKDGQRISVSLTVSPILDGAGNVVGASFIARDITGQVHAAEALRKSEMALKEAQRIAQIGSWDWDATTDTFTWSEEYHRIYNVDPNVPSPNYLEYLKMYTHESAERLAAEVAKTMRTGQPYELELELANPDANRRWIFARGEAKYDADRQIMGLRSTAQNITERKQAEAEILRLNANLEQRVVERTNDLETKRTELTESQKALMNIVEDLNQKTGALEDANAKLQELERLKSMFIASM
ncbi:MAG TPA: PAS domain S-box protein, partial [Geomonas sp.]